MEKKLSLEKASRGNVKNTASSVKSAETAPEAEFDAADSVWTGVIVGIDTAEIVAEVDDGIESVSLDLAFKILCRALEHCSSENLYRLYELADAGKFYAEGKNALAWSTLVRILEEEIGQPIRQS